MAADKAKDQPKQINHWVALHNFPFAEAGKVIPVIQWPKGTDFEALQRLGAIRPANPDEVQEGQVDIDPEATKEAHQNEVNVLKTQIDLLEKELAYFKDENQKIRLASPSAGPGVEPSEGVKTLIKKKDAAIGELTEKFKATEAERAALASQVDQLQKQLDAATKPQPQGEKK